MLALEHSALGDLHSGVSCMRMAWAHRPARTYPLTATRESVEPMGVAESPAGAQQATRKRVSVLLVRFALRRVQGQHLDATARHPKAPSECTRVRGGRNGNIIEITFITGNSEIQKIVHHFT